MDFISISPNENSLIEAESQTYDMVTLVPANNLSHTELEQILPWHRRNSFEKFMITHHFVHRIVSYVVCVNCVML